MVVEMVSSSTLMASLKALLVSTGAVSITVALRTSVPSNSDRLAALLSWFRPPYLFVIVNGIIVSIAATSCWKIRKISSDRIEYFLDQLRSNQGCFHRPQPEAAAATRRIAVVEEIGVVEALAPAFNEFKDFEEKRVVVVEGNGAGFGGGDGYHGDCEGERKVAFGRSALAPRKQADSSEKALVSLRLVRRKAANSDRLQGGKTLRKPVKRSNESMENVMKAIVEAGGVKSTATWPVKADDTDCQISLLGSPPPSSMQKSATFRDRTNQLRKELSPDELNRRAEAFINKFNEEMRLQRQESSNQFKEMISHGT
ncbi:hypothetical protein ACJRO7_017390 [Eucalyptus globulus]|uniref:DUF4408 domain-containing protein n=1 Tax=Eucalyptus globulus TaxID=34317 RepID=A0ABD3KPZ7_EUCGL